MSSYVYTDQEKSFTPEKILAQWLKTSSKLKKNLNSIEQQNLSATIFVSTTGVDCNGFLNFQYSVFIFQSLNCSSTL